jgi:hypothetical protein
MTSPSPPPESQRAPLMAVLPEWAQPGEYRHLPPRSQELSREAKVLILLVLLCITGWVIVGFSSSLLTIRHEELEVVTHAELRQKQFKQLKHLWGHGNCTEVTVERDLPVYLAAKGTGSARRLRGKVLMLYFRLQFPGMPLSFNEQIRLDQATIATELFYERQAELHGVQDLHLDSIPWKLHALKNLPQLDVEAGENLSKDSQNSIRNLARQAIEDALHLPLPQLIRNYRESGYDEVAFIVYLPMQTQARSFAWFTLRENIEYPDIAYIFSANTIDRLSVTIAHEGLHLFGARDLYRMNPADPADNHDLMNDYCTGFRETHIKDTTAYAIGWRKKAPKRSYQIKESLHLSNAPSSPKTP